jgi:hypothetical protein
MLVRLRLSVKERVVERKSGLRFVELKVAKTYRSGARGPGQDLIEAEESFGKLFVEIIDFLLATLKVGIFSAWACSRTVAKNPAGCEYIAARRNVAVRSASRIPWSSWASLNLNWRPISREVAFRNVSIWVGYISDSNRGCKFSEGFTRI